MSGWLIRISGWQTPEPIRLLAAAEKSPLAALVAVQRATGAAPKLRVETVGEISTEAFRKLGLERGQVLDLSSRHPSDERPFGFFGLSGLKH